MATSTQSGQDIDSALEATINGLSSGVIDELEARKRLRAIQKRLSELKRMSPEDQRRFFKQSKYFFE